MREFSFFVLLFLLVSGCAGLPPRDGPALPPRVREFPPVKPGVVRLPVEVIFPPGGDAGHGIADLFKGGVEKILEETILKTKLRGLWDQMAAPIFLDESLWLLIRPQTMSVGKARGDLKRGSTNQVVLEMTASPELVFGGEPLARPVPMPPLSPFQQGPAVFEAMSNVHMDYDDANRYLNDPRMKLRGTLIPGTGARKLTIETVRLFGSGDKVMVEVELNYNPVIVNLTGKPAHLTLYLRGTPRYVPSKRIYDLPDLDYDIKTNDLIVKVANWIFKSDFKNQMRKTVNFPIGEKMDMLKQKVIKALNRPFGPALHLRTEVSSFNVVEGFADDEGIEMRLSLRGTAALLVIWK